MSQGHSTLVTQGLLPVFITDFSIQIACWGVASLLQTEKFYDLAGSSTFILCTYLSLFKPWDHSTGATVTLAKAHPRQWIASGTTVIWAMYLGSFLFERALRHGDKRFNAVKRSPRRFLVYWLIQGVWVSLTALPVYITNTIPAKLHPSLGIQDAIGLSLWIGGFLFQAVANYQKTQWRRQVGPDYRRSFISHGLWSISRHPNYFGECMLWAGSYIVCASAWQRHGMGLGLVEQHPEVLSVWWTRLAMLSPLFVTCLITRVSGIPLLEKENDRRLKDVVAYWKYKKETSMFVPRPAKRS
ncbi:hypothetical protein BGZ94_006139 [Podila epigama]|nr:hypothetical protein BGZ94_006139 [Podila epigama]